MNPKNYFRLEVLEVHQIQNGIVLGGKISYNQLSAIHRLTERKESLIDPFEEKKREYQEEEEEFQRRLRNPKLKKIIKFLEENLDLQKKGKGLGLFPTSLILALDRFTDYEPSELDEKFMDGVYDKKLTDCFYVEDENLLFIPKNKRIALIVDGQHRYYGTKLFFESLGEDGRKLQDEFEFLATFLLGYDIWQVGQVFAKVNFTQKPVNRSLYYDIFGSIPGKSSDLALAHDLALHLNNNEKSPIRKMIKMLGIGYGLFSQAFFVENMLIHLKKGGVWRELYLDYMRGDKNYLELPKFMKIYLGCIKKVFSEFWPEMVLREGDYVYSVYGSDYKYEYILCKTTGLGAFFRLIKDIYPKVQDLSQEEMEERICDIFKRISRSKAEEIFSKQGEFGQAGSVGLQIKLYKRLKREFGLS